MPELTPRQQEVVSFVLEHQHEHGRTPSGPEIAARFGWHVSTAYQHLRQIEAKGLLTLEQTGRSNLLRIKVAEELRAEAAPGWPRFGSVPAGPVTPFVSDDVRIMRSLRDLIPDLKEGDFFLDVDGRSMINAGLEPGMVAVFRPGLPRRSGAICSVWVEGVGGTIKRVVRRGDTVELVPENPDFESQTYPAEQVLVQGFLVAALMVHSIR